MKDGRVVKGVNFVDLRDAGDPVEAAAAYDEAGAGAELCFLDITASHEKRGTILDVVARTAERCFMPLTVGGGIGTLDDARELLRAGATRFQSTPQSADRSFVARAAEKFGNQCIVVAIDAKQVENGGESQPRWEILADSRRRTGIDAIEFLRKRLSALAQAKSS